MEFVRSEIKKGRQVYVIYPLIEESEKLDLENLQDGYERLLGIFPRPDYQITVVHGRMKAQDKELAMQGFKDLKTQIMVSTTVIEVGVNVPNASVMIIENAERFGLAQLHQLRGRVGRGADQSYCILMTSYKLSKTARERLDVICKSNDGFVIAEADLKLRGPGDIAGTKQSGAFEFKAANLVEDQAILKTARMIAEEILTGPALGACDDGDFFLRIINRLVGISWGFRCARGAGYVCAPKKNKTLVAQKLATRYSARFSFPFAHLGFMFFFCLKIVSPKCLDSA
jgi:RecG-like helicase